jgi:hypothetical protein
MYHERKRKGMHIGYWQRARRKETNRKTKTKGSVEGSWVHRNEPLVLEISCGGAQLVVLSRRALLHGVSWQQKYSTFKYQTTLIFSICSP